MDIEQLINSIREDVETAVGRLMEINGGDLSTG